jgi:hypothetical protein
MTRDGILKLARQACHPHDKAIFASPWGEEWVLKFFALIQQNLYYDGIHTCNDECQRPACVAVRKAVWREQEACAKVADLVAKEIDDTNGTATYIAAAIRARGNQ